MKKGTEKPLQQTLFGAWGKGTPQQQLPLTFAVQEPFVCVHCQFFCKTHGALTIHLKMVHGVSNVESIERFSTVHLSTATLSQLQFLCETARQSEGKKKKKVGASDSDEDGDKEEDDEEEDDGDDEEDDGDAEEDEEEKESVSAPNSRKEKRRGQSRRIRRDVRFKFRCLALLDRVRGELDEYADENELAPPTTAEVIAKAREVGLMEPSNNLYKWLMDRSSIEEKYSQNRNRKKKSMGSGRTAELPKTESAVKKLCEDRRKLGLRVSRTRVKEWLKENAKDLEPDVAANLKFSKSYCRAAYRRMGISIRRISSSKAVTNEIGAEFGRYMCRCIMELREFGFSSTFPLDPDNTWCSPDLKDSVFGFFPPEYVFAADEVPFNFIADGMTAAFKGHDAAVRTLRGTGKRFGTCVMICDARGNLLKFVLIFKAGKKGFNAKLIESFKQYPNVVVVTNSSSYITESLWIRHVIDRVLLKHIMDTWGKDFHKRRYIFLSDNHSSHQTKGVIDHCERNAIFPCFTPPNYTSHWSMIDDYCGVATRAEFYTRGEAYEEQYFHEMPNGDGALDANQRRLLVVKWWHETWEHMQAEVYRLKRERAAKRVGLWVTERKPADVTYLPNPVRFHDTPYKFFGDILYNKDHPNHTKAKQYDFALPAGVEPVIRHIQAEVEDGYSFEEPMAFMRQEEGKDDSSEEEDEEEDESSEADMPFFREALQLRRARRAVPDAPEDKIVGQYDTLARVDGRKRRSTNDSKATK